MLGFEAQRSPRAAGIRVTRTAFARLTWSGFRIRTIKHQQHCPAQFNSKAPSQTGQQRPFARSTKDGGTLQLVQFILYGKGGEFATNDLENQELTMLALHLLQICLV
jgi:hypothetical protein